ncbi:MAG: SAM-dependent chlorinase/fluorinase [Deltaproteobacteria bacterium]|nr:SAM-dependent chlorinase/fluorinase [Deltaproteobacteria bacterium]
MDRIITLTTDFGLKDPYQGAMKGAILSINPKASIIDITHLISPGNIMEGAFILLEAYSFFPVNTIHVGVVDPGVGGERKPLLIETEKYVFVGPDNGLFSLIARNERVKRVIHLTESRYFLSEISSTFHGRDIFGPVAAHLSLDVTPPLFGKEIKKANEIDLPHPEKKGGAITGEVVYVDSFGNLITNITGDDILELGRDIEVGINGHGVKGLKRTYSDGPVGEAVSVISSGGLLEIAVNSGAASERLKASVGDKVTVGTGVR